MAIWGEVACGTSAWDRVVSMAAWTIPLAPFLSGRGPKRRSVYGGTSSIPPARGVAPLWTPQRSATQAWSRRLCLMCTKRVLTLAAAEGIEYTRRVRRGVRLNTWARGSFGRSACPGGQADVPNPEHVPRHSWTGIPGRRGPYLGGRFCAGHHHQGGGPGTSGYVHLPFRPLAAAG